MERTNIADRFVAFQRSAAGQQQPRRREPRRAEHDDDRSQRPPAGQLFDPSRHDPMRFALNHQRGPPAPSTSGYSSTSLSDARSLASSAFTLTSGTSASSASINSPNSPLAQAAPTNPFLAQLKKTYRDLCNKESRIVQATPDDEDDMGGASRAGVPSIVEPQSGEDIWLRKVKDHKDLVEANHALLRMSFTPSVPLTIQAIPIKYNIPARLWSNGFYRLLEALRHASAKSPAAFEHLNDYIYYAYGFYSCLFEEDFLEKFRPAWIEALGDLARYRMAVATHLASVPVPAQPTPQPSATLAVPEPTMALDPSPTPSIGPQAAAEFDLEDERDIWRSRARAWYALGLKDAPGTGKLHHHLGLLCRDDPGCELRAAYHFVKSMIASHPFDTARESIQPLFSSDAQRARMRAAEAGPVAQFVLILGLLFTRVQLDDFDTVLARFVERLEIEGVSAVREPEWIMIAVCCVGAVLEFGRPDGVIKSRGGLAARGSKPSTGSAALNKDRDVEMEDAAEDAEDLSRPMEALSTSAPATNDELPHHFTLAVRLFCAVLRFTLRQPKIRTTLPYGPQYNPFLTIALTFLATLVRTPAVQSAVERHVPWAQLAAFASHIVKRRAAGAEVSAGAKGRLVSNVTAPLPEDWCVRGTEWVRRIHPHGFWRPGRWNEEGDVLDAVAVRDGMVDDSDEAGNGAEEDVAAVLERGRCARLGAAIGGIVGNVDGMRWQEDAASRSKTCGIEGALQEKMAMWEQEDREEEEERERRKKWGARNQVDMEVDEAEVEGEEDEDDMDEDEDEEIRALKARRRELRARAAQTSPRRRSARAVRASVPAAPAKSAARITPGYTVLVLDTNIFLSALPTVSQLVSSQRWTVVVPLAVVTELDGLARQSQGAQRAVSFLEASMRASQSVGLGLKVQTSRGNYLPNLAVRVEHFGGHGGGSNGAGGGWERNMDDYILKSAVWQAENFIDRSAFLEGGPEVGTTDGAKARVVLVSSDRNLRVKARARELEAGDVSILAGLA
ncbi:Est1 DNA/RNA-binding domain protein [Ceratobasidium sp. AG-Ba]|nr:Est1 DNA/RNA-binding domain protein [Ceratobasidium sp. AG-Ba]